MKKFLALALTLVMALSLVACGGGTAEDKTENTNKTEDTQGSTTEEVETIKIGMLAPLTGGSASAGQYQIDAWERCIENINSLGGFQTADGTKYNIEMVIADTETTPDVGVTAYERLVTKEDVVCVFGTYNSNVAAAVAPLAEKYQIPFILCNSVADAICQNPSEYVFRANNSDSTSLDFYPAFYKFLNEQRGEPYKKVAFITDGSDWGQSMLAQNRDIFFPEAGWECVLVEEIQTNSADLSSSINKIKNSGAELLVPALLLNDITLLAQQLQEYNVDIDVASGGGGATDPMFLTNAGDAADYWVICAGYFGASRDALSEKGNKMQIDFEAELGYEFSEPWVNAWMAMGVFADALSRSESTEPAAIAASLKATNITKDNDPYESLLFKTIDRVAFDKDGWGSGLYNCNPYESLQVIQVQDGGMKPVYPAGEENLVWPMPAWSER